MLALMRGLFSRQRMSVKATASLFVSILNSQPVPLATWDPDDAERNSRHVSALAKPLRVTLDPGDMLYLPAMW